MAGQHHYVARFHLRGFTDPESHDSRDPWLWVGDCRTGVIKRRAPANIGWARGLYDGPAGFADRTAQLETFLAENVESPAAFALRGFLSRSKNEGGDLPAEVMRYLAWAATRTPGMRMLFQQWIDETGIDPNGSTEESPLLSQFTPLDRPHCMEHAELGRKDNVSASEVARLCAAGWRFVVSPADFLELAHFQAWYFQTKIFPALKWLVLNVPRGDQTVRIVPWR